MEDFIQWDLDSASIPFLQLKEGDVHLDVAIWTVETELVQLLLVPQPPEPSSDLDPMDPSDLDLDPSIRIIDNVSIIFF